MVKPCLIVDIGVYVEVLRPVRYVYGSMWRRICVT